MGCGGAKPSNGNAAQPAAGGGSKKAKEGTPQKKESLKTGLYAGKFTTDNPGKIMEFYEMDKKKIGEGSYGTVCKAKNKSTGQIRAVKTISKGNMKNVEKFKQEIAIMKMMDHPNIIKLFETFEDHRAIYLVMELCGGGELFDRIIEAGHFTESQAAALMQQIVKAINFMHSISVCHRDLKPENFIFVSKDSIDKTPLKIIDFGLSCVFTAGVPLTTKAGTPYYVAPQVLAGKYDQSSDLWSVGVIMYVMLCGYPPFFGETDAEVLSKVRLGNFSFTAADWKNVSEDAKNLIRMLLKMNPKDRYTAEQALEHEWIKNKAPQAKDVPLTDGFMAGLRGFRMNNQFKKAALHIIAGQLDDKKIKTLKEVFSQMDANGDGTITAAEMKEGLKKSGIDNIEDLEEILKGVDGDGNGNIDYTEFLAATVEKKHYEEESACWAAFRVFDKNGDGKITPAELEEVMGDPDVQQFFGKQAQVDKNADGVIDFEEFMAMMRGQGESKD